MSGETTLQVLRQVRDWERIEDAWLRLWQLDPNSTPFAHPAWLLTWWSSFGQSDLRVYALWRGGNLLALLPLYVLAQGEQRLLLLVGAGTSDYLDALVAPSCPDAELGRLVEAALAEGGWTEAHLTQLRAGSRLRAALAAWGGPRITPYAGESCSGCPALRVADLPRKLRADVLYFRNAAIAQGTLRLREAAADELAASFALLVRLHTAVWQLRAEPGVLADPAVLAHHAAALPRLHAAGLLRLLRLELEGEPIAVLYALVDPPAPKEQAHARRTQYLYLMGHAPEHAALRPGVLLTALAAEHAAAEGVAWLDMLRGEEAYKQFWRVEPEPTGGFRIEPLVGVQETAL